MQITVTRSADQRVISAVTDLLDAARRPDGSRPLSDRLWVELRNSGIHDYLGLLLAQVGHDRAVGYAQISHGPQDFLLEIVLHPELGDPALVCAELLDSALEEIEVDGGGSVVWWVSEPRPHHHQVAIEAGFAHDRTLYQMQAPLPIDQPIEITTRPFRPGVDDEEWLALNNRAFHGHGEQGEWSRSQLQARCLEPWFDPQGFLIYERDGQMLGFCWTKMHNDTTPPMGEIYVVATDPNTHGTGLGRQLTLAGLQHISSQGIDTAMLYVDADNTPALRLYERLGFIVTRTDLAFVAEIPAR
jgi:mycothiol synthase